MCKRLYGAERKIADSPSPPIECQPARKNFPAVCWVFARRVPHLQRGLCRQSKVLSWCLDDLCSEAIRLEPLPVSS